MHEIFDNAVMKVMDFDASDLAEFHDIARTIHIKRGQCLTKAGENIHRIGFIQKGVLEMIYISAKEVETVVDFFSPGNFVVDYVSYLTHTPAETEVRAISNSEVLLFERKSLDLLYEKSIRFQKFGRLMAEIAFVDFARRVRESSLPPSERYYKLMADHKDWIQEIPQYKIASYLNISAEWLSKIRSAK